MKSYGLILVALILTGVAFQTKEVGERFPDFTLKDLNGRTVSWTQFQGKVVVLNLWMTTCPPCRKEMPMLQQLQNKYVDRGVVVVGVSADDKARTASQFARKLGVRYVLLHDPLLMTSEPEQKKFGFLGLPTTFVIDRSGIIRKKIIGFLNDDELESAVRTLLAPEARQSVAPAVRPGLTFGCGLSPGGATESGKESAAPPGLNPARHHNPGLRTCE